MFQARKERHLHMQMYPGWSARDNYAQSKEVDFITSENNFLLIYFLAMDYFENAVQYYRTAQSNCFLIEFQAF